jgi:hypothetical protein
MTRMDEEQHPECDVYVEDHQAGAMVREALVKADRDLLARVLIIPFGSAQVGISLGMMSAQDRFPRPSVVYLDGDQSPVNGCHILPGGDAPERVVFNCLQPINWVGVAERVGRDVAETIDALNAAMTISNHHEWLKSAANRLYLGSDMLWQALCAQWSEHTSPNDIEQIVAPVREALA